MLKAYILFKALAGETRIKIIQLLRTKGPLGSKEIADHLKMTPAAISQHLKILKHSGILRSRRHGYWIPYSLDDEALQQCVGEVEHLCCGPMHGHRIKRQRKGKGDKEGNLDTLMKQKEMLEKELDDIDKLIEKINPKE
ncbi:metalloregulator ArsR/SmtB family transcription factor [Calditrichota bacterium]